MVKRYPDVDVRVFVAEPGTAHSGALLIDSQLKLRNLLREATKNGAQSVTMNQYLYRAEHIPNASCDTAEACADNNDLHGTILVDGEFAERECARRSLSVGTGDTTARHVVLDAVVVGCWRGMELMLSMHVCIYTSSVVRRTCACQRSRRPLNGAKNARPCNSHDRSREVRGVLLLVKPRPERSHENPGQFWEQR